MANLNIPDRRFASRSRRPSTSIVQVDRLSDGTRKVTSIAEITGMEGDVITMQDIFVFEQTGVKTNGKVVGRFSATGIRPKCWEKLAASGFHAADGHVRARAPWST